jgi:hypothetical protein
MTEELPSCIAMKGTTTGADTYGVKNLLQNLGIPAQKLEI